MDDLYEEWDLDPSNEIGVDPEQLDIEWIRQSNVFMKYARAAAAGEQVAKEAHESCKIIRSELIRDANADPDKCLGQGIKPTDVKTEAYYRSHRRHIRAKQAMISAEHERDVLNAAKSAIYMKKHVLEALLQLASMNWYSAPVTPKSMAELKDAIAAADNKTVEGKIRKASDDKKDKMTRG